MLRSLKLRNFRNHSGFFAEFTPAGAVLVGPNGAGKTSVIEAIYLLATLRSFRHSHTRDMMLDHDGLTEVLAATDEEELGIRVQMRPTKATAIVRNSLPVSASEFLKSKRFFAVLFSPEELQLPFALPKERRRFLNRLLSPLSPAHLQDLHDFEKTLAARNALLRRIQAQQAGKEELDFYDERLAVRSTAITARRARFFADFGERIREAFAELTGLFKAVEPRFLPDITDNALATIKDATDRDIARGATGRGAHHDDFGFWLDGRPLQAVGSRGEVRSALLALKLAEFDFIKAEAGVTPILLLDDVFSELDAERKAHLTAFISGKQSFLTTTETPDPSGALGTLPVITLEARQ